MAGKSRLAWVARTGQQPPGQARSRLPAQEGSARPRPPCRSRSRLAAVPEAAAWLSAYGVSMGVFPYGGSLCPCVSLWGLHMISLCPYWVPMCPFDVSMYPYGVPMGSLSVPMLSLWGLSVSLLGLYVSLFVPRGSLWGPMSAHRL